MITRSLLGKRASRVAYRTDRSLSSSKRFDKTDMRERWSILVYLANLVIDVVMSDRAFLLTHVLVVTLAAYYARKSMHENLIVFSP